MNTVSALCALGRCSVILLALPDLLVFVLLVSIEIHFLFRFSFMLYFSNHVFRSERRLVRGVLGNHIIS